MNIILRKKEEKLYIESWDSPVWVKFQGALWLLSKRIYTAKSLRL